jgi:hypothetical protein
LRDPGAISELEGSTYEIIVIDLLEEPIQSVNDSRTTRLLERYDDQTCVIWIFVAERVKEITVRGEDNGPELFRFLDDFGIGASLEIGASWVVTGVSLSREKLHRLLREVLVEIEDHATVS